MKSSQSSQSVLLKKLEIAKLKLERKINEIKQSEQNINPNQNQETGQFTSREHATNSEQLLMGNAKNSKVKKAQSKDRKTGLISHRMAQQNANTCSNRGADKETVFNINTSRNTVSSTKVNQALFYKSENSKQSGGNYKSFKSLHAKSKQLKHGPVEAERLEVVQSHRSSQPLIPTISLPKHQSKIVISNLNNGEKKQKAPAFSKKNSVSALGARTKSQTKGTTRSGVISHRQISRPEIINIAHNKKQHRMPKYKNEAQEDAETWDDASLKLVLQEFQKKYGTLCQVPKNAGDWKAYMQERPWLLNSKWEKEHNIPKPNPNYSQEPQPSLGHQQAIHQIAVQKRTKPVISQLPLSQLGKDKNQENNLQSFRTGQVLNSVRVAKKTSQLQKQLKGRSDIDMDILSKNIPRPQPKRIQDPQFVLYDNQNPDEEINNLPGNVFLFKNNIPEQASEDNRPLQMKSARMANKSDSKSRSASSNYRKGGQITGKNLKKERDVKVNLSPLPHESFETRSNNNSQKLRNFQKYDLPCQMRPRSILKQASRLSNKSKLKDGKSTSRSPPRKQQSQPEKQPSREPTPRVFTALNQGERNQPQKQQQQFMVTFSKKHYIGASSRETVSLQPKSRPSIERQEKAPLRQRRNASRSPSSGKNRQTSSHSATKSNRQRSQISRRISPLENRDAPAPFAAQKASKRQSIETLLQQKLRKDKDRDTPSPTKSARNRDMPRQWLQRKSPPKLLNLNNLCPPEILSNRSKSVQPNRLKINIEGRVALSSRSQYDHRRSRPSNSSKGKAAIILKPRFSVLEKKSMKQASSLERRSDHASLIFHQHQVIVPQGFKQEPVIRKQTPPPYFNRLFDPFLTDLIPVPHQYGVLQVQSLAKPAFRPGGQASQRAKPSQHSSSRSPSYCSGKVQSVCSKKSIRSRSPDQRADELGLQIFEFIQKVRKTSKPRDKNKEKEAQKSDRKKEIEKLKLKKITSQRAKQVFQLHQIKSLNTNKLYSHRGSGAHTARQLSRLDNQCHTSRGEDKNPIRLTDRLLKQGNQRKSQGKRRKTQKSKSKSPPIFYKKRSLSKSPPIHLRKQSKSLSKLIPNYSKNFKKLNIKNSRSFEKIRQQRSKTPVNRKLVRSKSPNSRHASVTPRSVKSAKSLHSKKSELSKGKNSDISARNKKEKVKQIIRNQHKILQFSKMQAKPVSLKQLALNLLDLSEQEKKKVRQAKVKKHNKQPSRDFGHFDHIEPKSIIEEETNESGGTLTKQKSLKKLEGAFQIAIGLQEKEDQLAPLRNSPPQDRESIEIVHPYQNSFPDERVPTVQSMFVHKVEQNNKLPPGFQSFAIPLVQASAERNKVIASSGPASAQPTFELSNQKDEPRIKLNHQIPQNLLNKVMDLSASVIQRWWRRRVILTSGSKSHTRSWKQNESPSKEEDKGALGRRKLHYNFMRLSESNYNQGNQFSQDFKNGIDQDIQNFDDYIQELQNTQNRVLKGKNEKLFETSQKSLLVSIQKSRRILSQVDSSGVGESSLDHNDSEFVTVQVHNTAEPLSFGVEENRLTIDQIQSSEQIIKQHLDEYDTGSYPIHSYQRNDTIDQDIQNQEPLIINDEPEGESLEDFVQNMEKDYESIENDKDKIQYISSLKSIEVQDILKPIEDEINMLKRERGLQSESKESRSETQNRYPSYSGYDEEEEQRPSMPPFEQAISVSEEQETSNRSERRLNQAQVLIFDNKRIHQIPNVHHEQQEFDKHMPSPNLSYSQPEMIRHSEALPVIKNVQKVSPVLNQDHQITQSGENKIPTESSSESLKSYVEEEEYENSEQDYAIEVKDINIEVPEFEEKGEVQEQIEELIQDLQEEQDQADKTSEKMGSLRKKSNMQTSSYRGDLPDDKFYEQIGQLPYIKSSISLSNNKLDFILRRKRSDDEYTGSLESQRDNGALESLNSARKPDFKANKKPNPVVPKEFMYHTMYPLEQDKHQIKDYDNQAPLSSARGKSSPMFMKSRYQTIDLLKNEKWPDEKRSSISLIEGSLDRKLENNLARPQVKGQFFKFESDAFVPKSNIALYNSNTSRKAELTPSSFYLETMQIINKVNQHVSKIKQNLKIPTSKTGSPERLSLRSMNSEQEQEIFKQIKSGEKEISSIRNEELKLELIRLSEINKGGDPKIRTIENEKDADFSMDKPEEFKTISQPGDDNSRSIRTTERQRLMQSQENTDSHSIDLTMQPFNQSERETEKESAPASPNRGQQHLSYNSETHASRPIHNQDQILDAVDARSQSENQDETRTEQILFEDQNPTNPTKTSGRRSSSFQNDFQEIEGINSHITTLSPSKENQWELQELNHLKSIEAAHIVSTESIVLSKAEEDLLKLLLYELQKKLCGSLVEDAVQTIIEYSESDIMTARTESKVLVSSPIKKSAEIPSLPGPEPDSEERKELLGEGELDMEELELIRAESERLQDIQSAKNKKNLDAEKKDLHQENKLTGQALSISQKDGIPQQISEKQLQIQQELESLQKAFSSGEGSQEKDQNKHNELIAGIDTSLETVESYIEDVFSQIRERAPQFLNAFLTPIYKDPAEQIQLNQRSQLEYQLNGTLSGLYGANLIQELILNNSMICILNVQLYLTLEKERENVIKEAIDQIKLQSEEQINEEELTEMISEADHIHNKAIFDAVNEAMNSVRPYGIEGEPMPWSSRPRKNVYVGIEDNIESVHRCLGKVLQQVKHKVLCWASYYAGSPHHQYGSNRSGTPPKVSDQIEQGALGRMPTSISEREIEAIINQEVAERDDKDWHGRNDNILTQVKLEISDKVADQLIMETIDLLSKLELERIAQEIIVKSE